MNRRNRLIDRLTSGTIRQSSPVIGEAELPHHSNSPRRQMFSIDSGDEALQPLQPLNSAQSPNLVAGAIRCVAQCGSAWSTRAAESPTSKGRSLVGMTFLTMPAEITSPRFRFCSPSEPVHHKRPAKCGHPDWAGRRDRGLAKAFRLPPGTVPTCTRTGATIASIVASPRQPSSNHWLHNRLERSMPRVTSAGNGLP